MMAGGRIDEQQLLEYVEGLLYFYGAADFEDLYRAVAFHLGEEPNRRIFKDVLDRVVGDENSCREIFFEDGLYCHGDVEDPRWVLEEQKKRANIDYRPVTVKEIRCAVAKQHTAFWHPSIKKLNRWLQDQFGWTAKDALLKILFAQLAIKNDLPHMQLVELFLEDLNFGSLNEIQPFISLISDLANHTPRWILKGWTSHEISGKLEKPLLSPLPAPFEFPGEERPAEKRAAKIGRNDPCPCGSGKKYKKCCGAPELEEEAAGPAPPAVKGAGAGEKPSLEEWRALYEAAAVFKEARCWEWMYNDDLFGVMDPETGEIAYCCIMGELGEHFGMGAYLGPEGLQSIIDIMESHEDPSMDFLFTQKCLMVSFEDRDALDKEDRAVIKDLELKFRGRKQWPIFRSYEPGLFPWFIDAWECRFLTLALQQALKVSLRCLSSKNILQSKHPRTFLVRVSENSGQGTAWSDRYLEAAPHVVRHRAFKIADELSLRRVLASGKRGRATWEADTFFAPIPIREGKGERPYYPKAFLIFDDSRGQILDQELMEDLSREGNRCIDRIVNLMLKSIIPSRIVVERDETYCLLKDLCAGLGIALEKVEKLKSIPLIKEELYNQGW